MPYKYPQIPNHILMAMTLVKVGRDVRQGAVSPIGVEHDVCTKIFKGNVRMIKSWHIHHDKTYALLTSDIIGKATKVVIFFDTSNEASIRDIKFWLNEFERFKNRPDVLLYGTSDGTRPPHNSALLLAEVFAQRARLRNHFNSIMVSSDTREPYDDVFAKLLWNPPYDYADT